MNEVLTLEDQSIRSKILYVEENNGKSHKRLMTANDVA